MEPETVLALYCKASDFDAATQTCAAPFYGVKEGLLPSLSVEEGVVIAGGIIATWALGFICKQGRRVQSS